MNVKLIAHTVLTDEFIDNLKQDVYLTIRDKERQALALTAIRTCYSHLKPTEVLNNEALRYFKTKASDNKGENEADRLTKHIVNSKHTSTLEHINYTFAIEDVSRSLLAQITRHRHFSYSVQSQRYVKFDSNSKSHGFDYFIPKSIKDNETDIKLFGIDETTILDLYEQFMDDTQMAYDLLREKGVPAEDARMILPNAALTNIVLTGNLRSILEFYSKRNPNTHAQSEIQELAEYIKDEVIKVDPWTKQFFNLT